MKTTDQSALVAPCGINCGTCAAYRVKEEPSLGEVLGKHFKWTGSPCPGCREVRGNCQFIEGTCETYVCISERGFTFCFECQEFPCPKLNPASDLAQILPHNLKVFNLCTIKHQGLAKFLEREPEIKNRYYRGKMAIGKGPQLG